MIRRFLCNVLDWHFVKSWGQWRGGDNFKSKCKYCNRTVLWSTGGWFSIGEENEEKSSL